ncbi:hypothetical protein B7486_78635, partial [cyanobacterium TDX16]
MGTTLHPTHLAPTLRGSTTTRADGDERPRRRAGVALGVLLVMAALLGPGADGALAKPTDLPLPRDVQPRTVAEAQANLDR